jgi:hypothetical protein
MKKFLLIASVAAMAIAVPAQAEREGRGKRAEAAEQNEQQRADRRAARQQQASDRGAARQQQASDRGAARQQQASDRRAAMQQQMSERRAARQQLVSDRRSAMQQQASDRRSARQQAVSDRRARIEQQASERRSLRQLQAADRPARIRQADSDRRARIQQERSDRQAAKQQAQSDRRSRIQQQQSDRRALIQQERSDRRSLRQQAQADRRARFQQIESDRRIAFTGDDTQWRQHMWQRQAERTRVLAERREKLSDRQRSFFGLRNDDDDDRRTFFRVGQQVSPTYWYDDYVPLRYATYFDDDDDYYYRYDGDYLYRLRDNDNVVLSLFPLLGGAYSVGNQLPFYQSSYYNVPWGYNSLYYDTPDSYYRYGDSAIYQVDPTTQLIAGIVALLTGQSLGIGQMLPMGYDVYNVPYAYRSNYYDTDDMWYRYDDGYIYGVDPRTRLIQSQYPVYNGYAVGQPWPAYAGYDYDVPGYYDDLYYDQPNYDYRFASGGIYQVDPATQLVTALVALVTGQNFAVGQPLPVGYDAYNVPFAYRDDYYDNDDNWYRYADGRIYQVDPRTRLIERVILV